MCRSPAEPLQSWSLSVGESAGKMKIKDNTAGGRVLGIGDVVVFIVGFAIVAVTKSLNFAFLLGLFCSVFILTAYAINHKDKIPGKYFLFLSFVCVGIIGIAFHPLLAICVFSIVSLFVLVFYISNKFR